VPGAGVAGDWLGSERKDFVQIRRAVAQDAEAISALIQSVAHFFTLHPQGLGAEGFLQRISPEAIQQTITAPNFLYNIGLVDDQLAGVVAVRDNTHLYHLFVGQAFQGRGFSRLLWQHAKVAAMAAGNHHAFTVNSTPYAVPVYERFGFTATGQRVETQGIAFVPMELQLPGSQSDITAPQFP